MPEGRWLTYDEIAAVRGTQRVGAIRWVQRHKWRRQPGNDGLVRVLVPPDALASTRPPRRSPPTVTPDNAAAFAAALAAVREAHAGEAAALREHLERAEKRVEELLAGHELTMRRVADADARAQAAQQAVEEFRRLEDARKARGRLARLRVAWRGK